MRQEALNQITHIDNLQITNNPELYSMNAWPLFTTAGSIRVVNNPKLQGT
jgi:hypothetical protein